jgi:2-methylaconitate cis-trans-isomerase PrpF
MTDFSKTLGASLGGGLFPTGNRVDVLDVPGIGRLEVSIVDLANMCVFFRAEDAGMTGLELPDKGPEVVDRYIAVRIAAQDLLGVDHSKTTPWPMAITAPKPYRTLKGTDLQADDYDVAVRMAGIQSMGNTMHEAYPGTASSCTAVASVAEGTIVNAIYQRTNHTDGAVRLAHPSGVMTIEAATHEVDGECVVDRAVNGRTVRPIMKGELYLRRAEIERLVSVLSADSPTRGTVPERGRAHAVSAA